MFSLLGPGAIVLSDAEVATAALQSGQDASRSFLDILNGQTWLAQTNGRASGRVSYGAPMQLGGTPPMGLGIGDGGSGATALSGTHVWAGGYGGDHRIDGSDGFGASSYHNRSGGVAFGIDTRLTGGLVAGVAGAIGRSDYGVEDIGGKGDATNFRVAAYGGWSAGNLYLSGALGYGHDEVDTERSFGFGSVEGDTEVREFLGSTEAGFRVPLAGMGIANPFANIKFSHQSLGSFTESLGTSGGLAMSINGDDDWWGRSIVGVRLIANDLRDGDFIFSPSASVGWAHNYGDGPVVNASVAGAPGFVSVVDGAVLDENQVHTGLGLTVSSVSVEGLSLTLSYAGEYGDNAKSSTGNAAIRYRW